MTVAPTAASDRRRRWAFAALLLWALALRLWFSTDSLGGRGRDVDERFNMANVASILTTGSLEPRNGYYGGLSYLPHAALAAALHALGEALDEPRLAMVRDGRLTPAGLYACRALQALFGLWSLVLALRLGTRLFEPAVGLLGAFLLAASFMHLNYSGDFKPDVQLLALMLLAFLWTLDAAQRPDLRRYLLAGIGVGLAGACKYNGAMIALPLLLATAIWHGRRVRAWAGLALAGGTAGLVYVIWNPFLAIRAEYLRKLYRGYYQRGIAEDEGHLLTLLRPFQFVFEPRWHGPAVALLALVGFACLAAVLARRRVAAPGRRELALFLAWPALYIGAYAALTTYAKRANFLPLLPFTALAAAWAAVAVWRRAAPRLTARARAALLAVPVALVGWQVHRASAFVYRTVVPSTAELAGAHLGARAPAGGEPWIVVVEEAVGEFAAGAPDRRATLVRVPALSAVATERLDLADAEVFPIARLREGEARSAYLARLARSGIAAERFPAGFRRAWGEELVAVVHPWRPDGEPQPLPLARGDRGFCASPPPASGAGGAASLDLLVPYCRGRPPAPELRLGDAAPRLWRVRRERRGMRFASERFRFGSPAPEVCVAFPPDACRPQWIEASLESWRPAAAPP